MCEQRAVGGDEYLRVKDAFDRDPRLESGLVAIIHHIRSVHNTRIGELFLAECAKHARALLCGEISLDSLTVPPESIPPLTASEQKIKKLSEAIFDGLKPK